MGNDRKDPKMRVVLAVLAAGALMLGGCSSDPVDGADNCTELAQAWAEGDQTDQSFKDDVVARATDLAGDALASGADLEATMCGIVVSEANAREVEENFDDIADEL